MSTKPTNILPHEASALAAGKLGALIRVVEPQPPSVESIYQRAGIEFSIFTDHHSKPGEFRVAGPVWAVREVMGVSSKKCPAGPKWISPFGPPGTALECREEWAVESTEGISSVLYYRCDYVDDGDLPPPSGIKWQPADSMPSWAVRFRAVAGEVRCVQLKDITEDEWRLWCPRDSLNPAWPVVAEYHPAHAGEIELSEHYETEITESTWLWLACLNREEGS